jgi:hypothetical protein
MPMRMASVKAPSAASCSFSRASAPRMASAVRTALSASSSCTSGRPKMASAASPTYFSTVPPKRRTSAATMP